MKINEKNLVYFATSNTPVDKEGWLLKRGEVNKNYQKRYFMLKGNLLFYLDKRFDKEPVGVIILEGCTIELAENEEQYAFKIVFHGAGDRTYTLGAESQDSMEAWMKALACASYDYMKLMVSELQRQLDELAEAEHQPEQELIVSSGIATHSGSPNIGYAYNHASAHRQRTNPFNKPGTDPDSFGGTRFLETEVRRSPSHQDDRLQTSATDVNTEGVSQTVTRRSFKDLHDEYGQQIKQTMQAWRQYLTNPDNIKLVKVHNPTLLD